MGLILRKKYEFHSEHSEIKTTVLISQSTLFLIQFDIFQILSMSQENNAMTLADRGRKLQEFEGLCVSRI